MKSALCKCTIARGLALLAALALIGGSGGCSVLRAPTKAVTAITPGTRSPQMEPAEVAMLVQRLADEYSLRTGQALDRYEKLRGTPEAASEVLRMKALTFTYAMRIAGGYNPYSNLIDMVAMISLNRSALEDYWIHTTNGPAYAPWLEASRVLETNVWQAAGSVFAAKQLEELRKALDQYRRSHPPAEYPLFARPLEFASNLKAASRDFENPTGILGFIGLDPTMGLDPAVQEVTRTRLFAERAMFTLQRMPTLMRLHTEILLEDLMNQPSMRQTLTNTTQLAESADRISRAAESMSQTAALLPDRIAAERAAILKEMEQQEGKLRDLSAEVGRSMTAAGKMSDSLSITITNFDALMKRFGVGEPRTNSVSSGTNVEPFRILDYAETATQIGNMARDLNVLIASVDQSTPRVAKLGEQATADAQKLVNHMFWLGLVLIVVFCVCGLLTALLYRAMARRFNRPEQAAATEKTREKSTVLPN